MSKVEILAELPNLDPAARREIFERLYEMEERDLLAGVTPEEKSLLDSELEEYRRAPDSGSKWDDVEKRIRNTARS